MPFLQERYDPLRNLLILSRFLRVGFKQRVLRDASRL